MSLLSGIFGGSKTSSSSAQSWSDSSKNAGNDLFESGDESTIATGDGITLGAGAAITTNYDLSGDIAARAMTSAEASALLVKEVSLANLDSANKYVQSNATMASQTLDVARGIASENVHAGDWTDKAPILVAILAAAAVAYAIYGKK